MQLHKTFKMFIQTNWYVKYWKRFCCEREVLLTAKNSEDMPLHDIKVGLWCVSSIRITEFCFIQKPQFRKIH
jgi:hypothetical protein